MEVAILIGSALSLGLFLHRTSRPAMQKHLLVMAKSMNFVDASGASHLNQQAD